MNVTVISYFRNALSYLERYTEQMEGLQKLLAAQGDSLHLVLGYGDSSDGTEAALWDETVNRFDASLVDVSHGGLHYGSIVHPERFRQLSRIGNTLLGHIRSESHLTGLIESDLIWSPEDALNLRNHLNLSSLPAIIAPMVMHLDGRFYDTYAYCLEGLNFKNNRPYHPLLCDRRYYRMDSVGSFFFTQTELARKCNFPEKDVVVGFCRRARELGATIILDSETEVYHP